MDCPIFLFTISLTTCYDNFFVKTCQKIQNLSASANGPLAIYANFFLAKQSQGSQTLLGCHVTKYHLGCVRLPYSGIRINTITRNDCSIQTLFRFRNTWNAFQAFCSREQNTWNNIYGIVASSRLEFRSSCITLMSNRINLGHENSSKSRGYLLIDGIQVVTVSWALFVLFDKPGLTYCAVFKPRPLRNILAHAYLFFLTLWDYYFST